MTSSDTQQQQREDIVEHVVVDDVEPPAGPSPRPELSAEEIVANRGGDVLLRHTILKSDYFPGCHNQKLTPQLDGAPNFRQVAYLPVYGVAIPTVSGLRTVLDFLGAAKGRRKVLWFNLREEPVLYINGRPFVVREADKPFANLEYTGIDRDRVEDMESRLKLDVLSEAAVFGGAVMVAHEDDNFQVVEDWEAVTEVDVQTPAEVYAELAKDGYDVDYLRVPITDEKAPKGDDFESLISRCWAPPEGSALMFNCQMGRGRTTTGMSIGCLLHLRRVNKVVAPPPSEPLPSLPPWFVAPSDNMSTTPTTTTSSKAGTTTNKLANTAIEDSELKSGGYSVIRSLLRALENGREAKVSLDLVLDACAAMQNLREAIASYRMRLFYESNDMRRQALLQVCLEYLERYYSLVEFSSYLDDPGFDPGRAMHITFAEWRDARPELKGILQRLLRSNPLAALSLDRPAAAVVVENGDSSGGDKTVPQASKSDLAAPRKQLGEEEEKSSIDQHEDVDDKEEEEAEEVLAHRGGSVLGAHTILKQDHFPGCHSDRLPAHIPGAPNFRGVPGDITRVYGGAIATAEGVRKVLEEVGAGPDAGAASRSSAVWHMMREEPVVFICGHPYVLREEGRPFKNLLEYRGIDSDRLDQMEQRLKNDVVEEAAKEGGRILVTLETSTTGFGVYGNNNNNNNNDNNSTVNNNNPNPNVAVGGAVPKFGHSLRQEYIPVSGAAEVCTPAQVFHALQQEGYRVTFIRVPLTDGTCPRPADFDAFYSAAAASNPSDALIYTCQLGGGRTTMGMAIGTLLRMHLNGVALPVASELEKRETLQRLDEDVGGGEYPRGGSDDEDDDEDEEHESRRHGGGVGVSDGDEFQIRHLQAPGGSTIGSSSNTITGHSEIRISADRPPLPFSSSSSTSTSATAAQTQATNTSAPPPIAAAAAIGEMREGPFSVSSTAAEKKNSLTALDPENKNLIDGEYVGMRRFTRILERGVEAKTEVDAVVDACGVLLNLRTSIMRYRKPKSVGKFFRPEIQARHSAFQRGSAYLERYCMLVAFDVYLHQCRLRGRRMTFAEWLVARPDVIAAREALHQNPAGALTPVPSAPTSLNHICSNLNSSLLAAAAATLVPSAAGRNVSFEEQRRVLLRRKGSTVGRRSILKSFTVAGHRRDERLTGGENSAAPAEMQLEGITDARKADGLPVYTVGNSTVDGWRRLLSALGARPGGANFIVITDLREELVLYVNGTAYIRRELEMPAAALHHAGIQAAKLEDLERRLRADMVGEAAAWGGQVLLHREVESENYSNSAVNTTTTTVNTFLTSSGGGGGGMMKGDGGNAAVMGEERAHHQQQQQQQQQETFPTSFTATAAAASEINDAGFDTAAAATTTTKTDGGGAEDITRTTEYQPKTQVAGFWELTGDVGDIDSGMCTPAEVFIGLAAEGYQINYRRVPLSRERTPQAMDLNHLHHQMSNHPGNKPPSYLFVSRTATGSSARFAAAFAASFQLLTMDDAVVLGGVSPRSFTNTTTNTTTTATTTTATTLGGMSHLLPPPSTNSAYSSGGDSPVSAYGRLSLDGGGGGRQQRTTPASLIRNDSDLSDLVRSAQAGEYRGVMNLCRVLPGGAEAKVVVDAAIDACVAIGNLRDDILRCKEKAEDENPSDPSIAAAARRLGLHYLQRYFFLIAFRVFLDSGGARGQAPVAFSEWVAQRREITYLLSNLELE